MGWDQLSTVARLNLLAPAGGILYTLWTGEIPSKTLWMAFSLLHLPLKFSPVYELQYGSDGGGAFLFF